MITGQQTAEPAGATVALYKVMSSERVGVGREHRFILIHCWPCQ